MIELDTSNVLILQKGGERSVQEKELQQILGEIVQRFGSAIDQTKPRRNEKPKFWRFDFFCTAGRDNEIRQLLQEVGGNKIRFRKPVESTRRFHLDNVKDIEKTYVAGVCSPDKEKDILRALVDAQVWTRVHFHTSILARGKGLGLVRVEDGFGVTIRPELKELLEQE